MAQPMARGMTEDYSSSTIFNLFSDGLWLVLDLYLPTSAKVTVNILLLIQKHVESSRRLSGFWPVQAITLGIDIVWTLGLWTFVPGQHQLVVQRTFYKSILPLVANGFGSWQRDGPSTLLTDNRKHNAYPLWLKLCWLTLLTNPRWSTRICVRVIIWVLLPLLCLVLVLYPLEAWKRVDPVFPRLLRRGYQVLDIFTVLPSGLLEGLPMTLQTRLSRLQQRSAARKLLLKYKYTSLKDGEIRLLVLKRRAWLLPGTIQGVLVHVPANDPGEFEALSYCWGNPHRSEEILLDGARFAITVSAQELLIARRSFWKNRIVWIDAICINQDDNHEKSVQIGLMRDIYHMASRVVAFPSADHRLRVLEPLLIRCSTSTADQFTPRLAGVFFFEEAESIPLQVRILAHCLSSDYFNRAWVFQEIIVGRKVHVYLGGRYISWDTLATALLNRSRDDMNVLVGTLKFAATAKTNQALFLRDRRAVTNITLMHNCRISVEGSLLRNTANGSGIFTAIYTQNEQESSHRLVNDLEICLFFTNLLKASDCRDRLFSLLGIVQHDSQTPLLRPDYDKSALRVFQDMALYLLVHTLIPSVNVLALAGTGFTKVRKLKQSWIPDLSEERECIPLTHATISGNRFDTLTETAASVKRVSQNAISVTGVIVDKIAVLSSDGPLHIPDIDEAGNLLLQDSEVVERVSDFIKSAISLVDRHKTRWPNLREGLWQILIAKDKATSTSVHEEFRGTLDNVCVYLDALRAPDFKGFLRALSSPPELSNQYLNNRELPQIVSRYLETMIAVCRGRLFGITESGKMCLLPPLVEVGSMVFVPFGAQLPYILHSKSTSSRRNTYELIGEAYVGGVVKEQLKLRRLEPSDIVLV